MKKGEEEDYLYPLFAMESNALKVRRAHPKSNSRRMREAIALVLFDIKNRVEGTADDAGNFRNEDNERLERALLMAFDPETNPDAGHVLNSLTPEELREYYRIPVMCLLRIKDSVDLWEKRRGTDGYFDFLEQDMGAQITDDEMHFSAQLPEKLADLVLDE